jgi:hypothetical protein
VATTIASADELELRHLLTDAEGNYTVLFSVLDNNNDPIADVEQLPLSGVTLSAGSNEAELTALELEDPTLVTLNDYDTPFKVFVLLPNTDSFNGGADDVRRPDASGLRAALTQALGTLPERSNITVQVGVYNDRIDWLPEFNTTQIAEMSSEIIRGDWVAAPGTRAEAPFQAIENAYRSKLRRQSREGGGNNFVYWLIIVTSGNTQVEADFSREAERIRGLLGGRDMSDVITLTIVYNPGMDASYLHDPTGSQVRFATGVTPANGTSRLVGNIQGIRSAFQQTFDEIASSFVLRGVNSDLPGDTNMNFRLAVTVTGGEELTSDVLLAHVEVVPVNIWGHPR